MFPERLVIVAQRAKESTGAIPESQKNEKELTGALEKLVYI